MKTITLAILLAFAAPAFADPADDYRIRQQEEEQRRQLEEIRKRQEEQQRQIDEQNRRLEMLRRQTPSPGTLGGSLGRGLGAGR